MLSTMAWLVRTFMIFGLLLSPLQVCQANPLPMDDSQITFGCHDEATPDDSRDHSSPDCRVACAAPIPLPVPVGQDFAAARSYSDPTAIILAGHYLPVATPPPRSGSPNRSHNQI